MFAKYSNVTPELTALPSTVNKKSSGAALPPSSLVGSLIIVNCATSRVLVIVHVTGLTGVVGMVKLPAVPAPDAITVAL